jgi:hypothetical protein
MACCSTPHGVPPPPPLEAVFIATATVMRLRSETELSAEVWQLATLRLPCWVVPSPAEQAEGHVPAQPLCIFLIRLSPTGALLEKRSVGPRPDSPPAARDLVDTVVRAALAGGRRPERVEFSEPADLAACTRSLEGVGVRAVLAPLHPGLTAYAADFARKLAETPAPGGAPGAPARPLALITPQSAQPGLRDAAGGAAPDALLRAYYALADDFALARPWERVPDRQTFRLRVGAGAPVWAAVVGQEHLLRMQEAAARGQNPNAFGPPRLGLAVFAKRADAEARLLAPLAEAEARAAGGGGGAGAAVAGGAPPPPPTAIANPLDQVCGACGARAATARCTGCADAYYCDEACQKAAFAAHKAACVASRPERAAAPGKGPALAKPELVVLFQAPMNFPFADHDDVRRLGVPPNSPLHYALALKFAGGAVMRPNRDDVATLARALAVVTAFVRARPDDAGAPFAMTEEAPVALARASATVLRGAAAGAGAGAGATAAAAAAAHAAAHAAAAAGGATGDAAAEWWLATGDDAPPAAFVRTDPMVTRREADSVAAQLRVKRSEFDATSEMLKNMIAGAGVAAAAGAAEGDDAAPSAACGCCRRAKAKAE